MFRWLAAERTGDVAQSQVDGVSRLVARELCQLCLVGG